MRFSLFGLAVHAALATAYPSARADTPVTLYVTLQSTGILELAFDPSQGVNDSISIIRYNTNAGDAEGWITRHGDKLYSIARGAEDSDSGTVFAWQEPARTPPPETNLTLINSQSSHGKSGVYVDVSKDGRTFSAANIDGSTVSVYPLEEDGSIGDATYVFHYNLTTPGPGTNDSQNIANPHQSIFDPTGEFMFVPDRGSDRLYAYYVAGPDQVTQIQNITLLPGTGPRHITFSPLNSTVTYMYLVSELDNTIRVFTVDYAPSSTPEVQIPEAVKNVTITLKQTISTLGKDQPRTPPNNDDLAAEIAITNDRKFAYAVNRNTLDFSSDTMAIYSVDPNPENDANHLTYLGFNLTLGKIPRDFAISNDEQNLWVAIANEVTQDIEIFERDVDTGFFKELRGSISLGGVDTSTSEGPTCILWN